MTHHRINPLIPRPVRSASTAHAQQRRPRARRPSRAPRIEILHAVGGTALILHHVDADGVRRQVVQRLTQTDCARLAAALLSNPFAAVQPPDERKDYPPEVLG
jgi:hypothetical protein